MSTAETKHAVMRAYETGHFWSPNNPDGLNVKPSDLATLDPSKDEVARRALESMTKGNSEYVRIVDEDHNRPPTYDGLIGPSVMAFVDMPRCMVPDFAPPPGVQFSFDDPHLQEVCMQMQADYAAPRIGDGNWAGCHGIGNFHKAIVRVDERGLPSHLSNGVFEQVLSLVQKAYAQVGLLFVFRDREGKDILTDENVTENVNIEFSFVNRSDGWIGLAIVGQGQRCSSNIWCRYLSTYRGGSSKEAIIDQWTSLVLHELGHNCGSSHRSGGHMNPSIINGLPRYWYPSDPSTAWMKSRFGGEPVNIGEPPTPPQPPVPPTDLESRVKELERELKELQLTHYETMAQVAVNTYWINKLREEA